MSDLNRYESLIGIIKNRRSTRSFKSEKIPEAEINKLIEAGIYAPTGSNSQNVKFLIVNDPDELKKIGSMRFCWPYPTAKKMIKKYPWGLIGNAICTIFLFSDSDKRNYSKENNSGEQYIWKNLDKENASAAIQNILLTATSLGIGSCWISINEEMNYTRLLMDNSFNDVFSDYEISDNLIPQGAIILGYPRQGYFENYPKGEKKHGPYLMDVKRKELTNYLIKNRKKSKIKMKKKIMYKLASGILKRIIFMLLFFVKKVDQVNSKILK